MIGTLERKEEISSFALGPELAALLSGSAIDVMAGVRGTDARQHL